MINPNKINQFVAKYGIHYTERAILKRFLDSNNLEVRLSSILQNVLEIDEVNDSFLEELKAYETRELTNFLEILIPQNDQKINGAYFTPSYIVDFIINEIQPKENDTNLDPSCGSGAFLIGLVDYYRREFRKNVKDIIRENIFGSDILEYNIHRAKNILAIYALQFGEILHEEDFNLWHQDNLRVQWQQQFNNIIGNPPYVKFQDLNDENRDYLLRNWTTIKKGTFNLYFAFFELGYNLLKQEGKLGYITPNNYFTSLSAEPLRNFFQHQKCISRIIDFSHRKVFDARTYTAITFLSKNVNDSIVYDRIKQRQTPKEFLASANGSSNLIKELNTKKWRLLKSDEQKIIKTIETVGTPIGNLFDICVGIATLKDEVFFVDSNLKKNSYLIKSTENGVFEIETAITKPVYKISDFRNQKEISQNSRRIICPYYIEKDAFRTFTVDELKERFPKCFEYLLSEKEKLATRDKGKIQYQPFFTWGRTQGIRKFGKKILTPTFSQSPRFLLAEESVSYFTNGYGIFLRPEENFLFKNPLTQPENMDVVQKILNSFIMNYFVTKTSVSIEGGYPCYQKNFIEKFTIPPFEVEEIEELRQIQEKTEIDCFLQKKYGINFNLEQEI